MVTTAESEKQIFETTGIEAVEADFSTPEINPDEAPESPAAAGGENSEIDELLSEVLGEDFQEQGKSSQPEDNAYSLDSRASKKYITGSRELDEMVESILGKGWEKDDGSANRIITRYSQQELDALIESILGKGWDLDDESVEIAQLALETLQAENSAQIGDILLRAKGELGDDESIRAADDVSPVPGTETRGEHTMAAKSAATRAQYTPESRPFDSKTKPGPLRDTDRGATRSAKARSSTSVSTTDYSPLDTGRQGSGSGFFLPMLLVLVVLGGAAAYWKFLASGGVDRSRSAVTSYTPASIEETPLEYEIEGPKQDIREFSGGAPAGHGRMDNAGHEPATFEPLPQPRAAETVPRAGISAPQTTADPRVSEDHDDAAAPVEGFDYDMQAVDSTARVNGIAEDAGLPNADQPGAARPNPAQPDAGRWDAAAWQAATNGPGEVMETGDDSLAATDAAEDTDMLTIVLPVEAEPAVEEAPLPEEPSRDGATGTNPASTSAEPKPAAKKVRSRVIIYTVVKNDTFWSIAERFVHNPYKYKELAKQNNVMNPDLIYPGNKIRIIKRSK